MYLICYLFIFRLCSIYRVGFSLLLRVHILVPSRFMRKFVCRLRLSEVSRQ